MEAGACIFPPVPAPNCFPGSPGCLSSPPFPPLTRWGPNLGCRHGGVGRGGARRRSHTLPTRAKPPRGVGTRARSAPGRGPPSAPGGASLRCRPGSRRARAWGGAAVVGPGPLLASLLKGTRPVPWPVLPQGGEGREELLAGVLGAQSNRKKTEVNARRRRGHLNRMDSERRS